MKTANYVTISIRTDGHSSAGGVIRGLPRLRPEKQATGAALAPLAFEAIQAVALVLAAGVLDRRARRRA